MSSYGWYRPTPKQTPPERGIKVKKVGATWWGQRWLEALQQVLSGDSGRLARGRTYARAGRTHDLVVKGGIVTAKVTGSRPKPYAITITLKQLSGATWEQAIAGMAQKAQFTAELLAGEMPRDIDEVFRTAGTSLFPQQRADLVTSCSCPDWGDPCKHVAATHYVLGEALDRDPGLLFELRGRTKAQVLEALRLARGAQPAPASTKGRGKKATVEASGEQELPGVAFGKVKSAEYDVAREKLPDLRFSFDVPVTHGAMLRQLGAPAVWAGAGSPADALSSIVGAAAEAARRLALAEPESPVSEAEPGQGEGEAAPRVKRRSRKWSARQS